MRADHHNRFFTKTNSVGKAQPAHTTAWEVFRLESRYQSAPLRSPRMMVGYGGGAMVLLGIVLAGIVRCGRFPDWPASFLGENSEFAVRPPCLRQEAEFGQLHEVKKSLWKNVRVDASVD